MSVISWTTSSSVAPPRSRAATRIIARRRNLRRPGAESSGRGVAGLGRTDRALQTRRRTPLVHAPEPVDVGLGTVGADPVPVVVTVAGVDLSPERGVARTDGDDLVVQARVVRGE